MCTKLRSAYLVDALETELRMPVLDSVAAFVWKAARLYGGALGRCAQGGWSARLTAFS